MEEFQIVGWDDECALVHADQVGSVWSSLKKTVKKVGKTVGKAAGSVARNKVFQVVMPAAALGYHTIAKPLGGRGAFSGTLGKIVDAGSGAALKAAGVGSVASMAGAALKTSAGAA